MALYLTLEALIATLISMLIGQEGEHWEYYETDPQWWQLRLWTRQN